MKQLFVKMLFWQMSSLVGHPRRITVVADFSFMFQVLFRMFKTVWKYGKKMTLGHQHQYQGMRSPN